MDACMEHVTVYGGTGTAHQNPMQALGCSRLACAFALACCPLTIRQCLFYSLLS